MSSPWPAPALAMYRFSAFRRCQLAVRAARCQGNRSLAAVAPSQGKVAVLLRRHAGALGPELSQRPHDLRPRAPRLDDGVDEAALGGDIAVRKLGAVLRHFLRPHPE